MSDKFEAISFLNSIKLVPFFQKKIFFSFLHSITIIFLIRTQNSAKLNCFLAFQLCQKIQNVAWNPPKFDPSQQSRQIGQKRFSPYDSNWPKSSFFGHLQPKKWQNLDWPHFPASFHLFSAFPTELAPHSTKNWSTTGVTPEAAKAKNILLISKLQICRAIQETMTHSTPSLS